MSALNAMRPAQTGQIMIMPAEDLAAYRLYVDSFVAEYKPQGATESQLVQALADAGWRLNRVAALESTVLALGVKGNDELQNALSIAGALESQSKALASLSMHSPRLSRQFERTAAQLRELQDTRRATEKSEIEEALDVIEMFEASEEAFDPAQVGYVFSEEQIANARQARNRRELVKEAALQRYETAS